MKFSRTIAAAVAFTFTTPVFADTTSPFAPNASTVDFQKVNTQIQQVIDQTFQADELIENVSFRIQPKNASIDPLRLQLEASATAKSSPWAQDQKTVVQLSAKAVAGNVQADGKVSLAVQLKAGFQTPVVRLANFLAGKALQRLGTPPSDPAELPDFQKLEALVTSIAQAKTLSEIAPALVELKTLFTQKAGSEAEYLSKIQIVTETVDGNTRSIAIRYTEKVEFYGMIFKNIALKLNDSTILGGVTVTGKLPQQQLAEIQGQVTEVAKKIESGDADTLEGVKQTIAGWAKMAKEMLSGDFS